jgi:glycosyltransferase involved in cell wall biosynthesis
MPVLRRYHASVVIPAFNEGLRLPPFLAELARIGLDHLSTPVEILVIDDGSSQEQVAALRACVAAAAETLAAAGSRHTVRLVESLSNQGKGSAIRLGWNEADPDSTWLGFLDADGAVPAAEFWRLVRMLGDDVDVLAGSRILMAGRHVHRSVYRHLQGRVFATLTEWSFGLGFYDTQCGVKLMRAALLRPHLAALRERGWLLDVELLALMLRQNARLREEPIDWADPGGSKVRFGVDALRMLLGLRRIKRGLAGRLDGNDVISLEDARRTLEQAGTAPDGTAGGTRARALARWRQR